MEVAFSDVGSRITKRIRGLSLKQLDICNRTGLSTTALSQYCTGKRIPDTVSLYKLSTTLGVSMEWILTGEDSTTENAFSFDLEAVKQEQGLMCDGSPLDAEETDLVAMYRLLPSHVREDMFEQVFCLYRKYAERKRESIYWTYAEDRDNKKSGPTEGREARDGTA